MILTYRYRVKNLGGLLNRQARAINFVWNFCNDRQKDALKWGRKWLTGYQFGKLTAGTVEAAGFSIRHKHSCGIHVHPTCVCSCGLVRNRVFQQGPSDERKG